MAWITLSSADVKARLSGPEWEAVSEAALVEGQTDPWPEILDDLTETIRGMIGGGSPRNTLGAAGTLPAAAKRHALSLAIWDGLGRFGLNSLLGETRKADYEAANKFFDAVAAGRIAVEQPETAGDETFANRAGGFETVDPSESTKRTTTRSHLDGLL